MQKNRKFLISSTILVIIMILMAGTFAWTQMVNKVNEFIGNKTGGDVILHDDFDPITGNKDVYVENPNNADLFIRVKLNEVMDLTSSNRITTGWQTHTPGATIPDCGHSNAAGDKFHDYFKWTLGGQKYYKPAAGGSSVVTDNNVYNGSEPGVQLTPNAQIMSMADYMKTTDAFAKTFYGWIYDTDGYAYWSQPLKQGEVTGLLLNQVTISPSLDNTDYYYAIDVILEAVDIKDIPMWTQGAAASDGSGLHYNQATTQGKEALNYIVGLSASSRSVTPPSPSPALASQPAPTQIPDEATPDIDAKSDVDEATDDVDLTPEDNSPVSNDTGDIAEDIGTETDIDESDA